MSSYSIFSLVALLLKTGLAAKIVFYKEKVEISLLGLLGFLFVLNLLEFLWLIDYVNSVFVFKLFYVLLIIALAQILIVIKLLSNIETKLPEILFLAGSITASILLTTDLIVAGYKEGGIGNTRISGDYYYVFQAYAFICLILSMWFILSSVYSKRKNSMFRARSSILLVSLLPLVIGLFIVLILMAAGKNINAAVLLPITTTIFLFGCFYAANSKKLLDYSIFMPFSPSWQAKKDLAFFLYSGSDKSEVWKHLKGLERIYIEEAMKENLGKGQLTKAAKSLGITPGKLDYRLKSIHQLNE